MMRHYESKRERESVAMITKQFKREEKTREPKETSKSMKIQFHVKNLSIFFTTKVLCWLHFDGSVERRRTRDWDYFDIFAVVTFFYFYCANPYVMI